MKVSKYLRFSTQTLFIVLTAFACLSSGFAYEFNWLKQRQAVIDEFNAEDTVIEPPACAFGFTRAEPLVALLFEEKKPLVLYVPLNPEDVVEKDGSYLVKRSSPQISRVMRLFPEAVPITLVREHYRGRDLRFVDE